ncbi:MULTISPECIES: Fic family protein [unclassified Kocuria]|uniref:Fic/DOC family protein n=1 Tax=unclassified Kocuria TaxID=2649579 RepID=UPI001E5F2723|nr:MULTISPECIES: Fic family protein [unclassified Kocuria]
MDPSTGVLKNLVDARFQADLDAVEGDLVPVRTLRLNQDPPEPTGDLSELRAIHRFLFSPIYAWAGGLRTVDIRKNLQGADFFVPVQMIQQVAGIAAEHLRADDYLRGMGRPTFVARLAHHYDQFNYIHPFRDGNGRTHRWFWGWIARDAGWQLNWRAVTGAANDSASRAAAEHQDLGPLIAMFDQVVVRHDDDGGARSHGVG